MKPLGDQVKRELRRHGPNAGMSEVLEAWPAAVGPEIARNAWPARFQRDGTLIAHTKDAVWGFELGQRLRHVDKEYLDRLSREPALLQQVSGVNFYQVSELNGGASKNRRKGLS